MLFIIGLCYFRLYFYLIVRLLRMLTKGLSLTRVRVTVLRRISCYCVRYVKRILYTSLKSPLVPELYESPEDSFLLVFCVWVTLPFSVVFFLFTPPAL